MGDPHDDQQSFFAPLVGDGRPLLSLTGMLLILAGLFALFLGMTKHFLPHDVAYLGMTPQELCAINECRIVHFMIHDRISFGGVLVALGTLYLWLAAFPLRHGEPWAWWLFALSGGMGFGSFLLYFGYGYLDTWHGVATLGMLPIYLGGMARSYLQVRPVGTVRALMTPGEPLNWRSVLGCGRLLLILAASCIAAGGFTITMVGMTRVFVPQDLTFMNMTVEDLHRVNPRLLPLIAHDRAGFGGGVFYCGVTLFFCLWCSPLTRSLWQATLIAGLMGFGTAIFVHFPIGYTDASHLTPAVLGALMMTAGLTMTWPRGPAASKLESIPAIP
ncbi:MAG: hypothetical protein ACJ8C4_15990 [Gemmataceae bacterium]